MKDENTIEVGQTDLEEQINKTFNLERRGDAYLLTLVKELKRIMNDKGVSINELARRSGISVATVSRTLSFKTHPAFEILYEMFAAMNTELTITITEHKEVGDE